MGRKDELITPEQAEITVQKYLTTVYRLAFAQLHNSSDADDVTQEVFLRFVRSAPVFESDEHEKAWFLRVTVNCCKKFWASTWRKRDVPLTEAIQADTPENHYLCEELKKLPKKYSLVLHLFYWEDMTTEEISSLLNLRSGSVRSRLSRARALLKAELEGGNWDA